MNLKKGIAEKLEKESENKRMSISETQFSSAELSPFTHLENLSVRNSKFEASSGISFPNVTTLSISFDNLSVFDNLEFIPPVFPNLKELKLSKIENFEAVFSSVSLLKSLKRLTISDCKIDVYPKEFSSLKSLVYLNLERNELEKIPAAIAQLNNLEILDVRSNKLIFIAPQLTKLSKLRSLLLEKNKLQKLPKLEKMDLLMEIELKENKFTSIPPTIFRCRQLVYLYMDDNPLKKIGTKIEILPLLRRLTLANCGLETLPTKVGHFRELRHLDLSQNRLSKFPLFLYKLPNLDILLISNNVISKLPLELGKLDSLRQLNLEGNQLRDLPISIAKLKNLRNINLERNEFDDFPDSILALPPTTHVMGLPNKRFHAHFKRKISVLKSPSKLLINAAFKLIKNGHYDKHLSWKNIGDLLQIDLPVLLNKVLQLAVEKFHKKRKFSPINSSSFLFLLGEINVEKSYLDNLMTARNIKWTTDFYAASHYVLGAKPDFKLLDKAKNNLCNLLTERDLYSRLFEIEKPFLLGEEGKEMRQNIKELFISESLENKMIALHSMHGGGVPQRLKSEMILFALNWNNTEKGLEMAQEMCWTYFSDKELEVAFYFWGIWQDKYVYPTHLSLEHLEEKCLEANLDFKTLKRYYEEKKDRIEKKSF